MHKRVTFWLVLVTLLAQGCVNSALKEQVAVTAVANDRYDRLVRMSLGEIPFDGVEGVALVTSDDLVATPAPVRALLGRVTTALYKNRRAWHVANHAANDAADPDTMDLQPPAQLVPQ